MPKFNFDNKIFSLVSNSENGEASSDTLFNYKQHGNLVTADYEGGEIKYGKVIALLENDKLHMLYQCITYENELKAGRAIADVRLNDNNKIVLRLNWEWLDEKNKKGVSEYIEN